MEKSATSGEKKKVKSSFVIGDVGAYVEKYGTLSRPGRVKRLLFVAQNSSEGEQSVAFGELAVKEAKEGSDTALYKECVGALKAGSGGSSSEPVDGLWIESTDSRCRERQERLESELAAKRSSLNKEAIWQAYCGLGDYFVERGEASHALKCFVRMRDYSTSSRRTAASPRRTRGSSPSSGTGARASTPRAPCGRPGTGSSCSGPTSCTSRAFSRRTATRGRGRSPPT